MAATYKNVSNGQTGFGGFLALGDALQGYGTIPNPSNGTNGHTYQVLAVWKSTAGTLTYLCYDETAAALAVIT